MPRTNTAQRHIACAIEAIEWLRDNDALRGVVDARPFVNVLAILYPQLERTENGERVTYDHDVRRVLKVVRKAVRRCAKRAEDAEDDGSYLDGWLCEIKQDVFSMIESELTRAIRRTENG